MLAEIIQSLGTKVCSHAEALNSFKRAIIFGAGGNGQRAFDYLCSHNKEVLFYCDNDIHKHGTSLQGKLIYSPDILNEQDFDAVIIASGWAKEVTIQLQKLGITRYYDFTDVTYLYQADQKSEAIWQRHFDPKLLQVHQQQIDSVYSNLKDESSRKMFKGLLKYRLTMDPSYLVIADYDQYFHPVVQPVPDDVIVDAGAWKGDVSISFAKHLVGRCKIYAFEPAAGNILDMQIDIRKEKLIDVIIPVNKGVWHTEQQFRLNTSANYDQGFYLDENGTELIELTGLDQFSKGIDQTINFIKMDVEGAEVPALNGAEQLIRKNHPRLQICVYHRPEDLWEIPEIICGLFGQCDFYFGHHGQHLHESVLYVC